MKRMMRVMVSLSSWPRGTAWLLLVLAGAITVHGQVGELGIITNSLAPNLGITTNSPARKRVPRSTVVITRYKNETIRYVTDNGTRMTVFYDRQHSRVLLNLPQMKRLTLARDFSNTDVTYVKGNQSFWEEDGEVYYAVNDKIVYHGVPESWKKRPVKEAPAPAPSDD